MTTHSKGKYVQYRSGRYAFTRAELGAIRARGTENEHLTGNLYGKQKRKEGAE